MFLTRCDRTPQRHLTIPSLLAGFSQPGAHALLIEADVFYADREQVVCNLLIVLERESMERLLAKVAGRRERGVHGKAE